MRQVRKLSTQESNPLLYINFWKTKSGTKVVQNRFVGTWRLVSFELNDEKGEVTYPYGKDT
ncbi:MAG: lipocalin-like domain-containing protein, partial [Okeania sp. SIO2D1]|nr:lipocalin-like domain-containing protein [Okeania sp. SIO2D1]